MAIPFCVACNGVYQTEEGTFTDVGPQRRGAWIHKKCMAELTTNGKCPDERGGKDHEPR